MNPHIETAAYVAILGVIFKGVDAMLKAYRESRKQQSDVFVAFDARQSGFTDKLLKQLELAEEREQNLLKRINDLEERVEKLETENGTLRSLIKP